MVEKWVKFAWLEGLSKATVRTIKKPIGKMIAQDPLAGATLTAVVIGFVQMLGGLIGARAMKQKLIIEPKKIRASLCFGLTASLMTILVALTFTYEGADVGITTFFISFGIVFSAVLDRIIFKKRLVVRQMIGIAAFFITAYVFLGFPRLEYILSLPIWIWLSLLIGLLWAINELISSWVKDINVFVYNFWVGLTTLSLGVLAITFLGGWNLIQTLPLLFWLLCGINGLIVLAMITLKLLSYKGGGYPALKTLAMQSSYLIMAVILGIIFFEDEVITLGKVLGIVGFIISYTLVDEKTWGFIKQRIRS